MIADEVEALRGQLHGDILNLHLDMMRQFEMQKVWLRREHLHMSFHSAQGFRPNELFA
jgi:hypothetical protein